MQIVAQYLALFLGAMFFGWGMSIAFYDNFYVWWRDRYWKEPNDKHLSWQSVLYNRYITGLGAVSFGIAIVWLGLSMVN